MPHERLQQPSGEVLGNQATIFEFEKSNPRVNVKRTIADGGPAEPDKCGYTADSGYFHHLLKTMCTLRQADI